MLPPGPRTPALWQTFRFMTRPLAYSRKMIARYGDAIRTNALNGRGIAVSSPELARLVFAADPDTFETVPVMGELLGRHSVLATAGPTHRRQRKLLNPRFHGARMKLLYATMDRVVRQHLEVFADAQRRGEPVVLGTMAQALTLDVILETTFGESARLDRAESRAILVDIIHRLTPAIFAAPVLRHRFVPQWRRFVLARARFDAWVDGLVAERRASATGPGSDILGMLVEARYDDGSAMDDAEIRDQVMTLLIAGHETTAVALTWGVHFLVREPAVLAKLRAELDKLGPVPAPEAILKLPYLGAVGSESLRIEPVVTDVARVCRKPLVLGEWTVPPGEIVFVNLTAILHDERIYPEPHRFRPERFLERTFGPTEFLPFGGGQRRCLGAAFAEAELALGLAAIASGWDLRLANDRPEVAVRRNITMGPKSGSPVHVVGRRTTESGARAMPSPA